MKKNTLKYICYATLTTAALMTVFVSTACSGPEMPKMTVSYGPEIGFADGNVNLSGTEPIINISDIKAEVGMNIDYLSDVVIQNEEEFTNLEIRVDASMVDIFTPGNYKVIYTFLFNDNLVSKEITVSLFESEKSTSKESTSTSKKPTDHVMSESNETSTTRLDESSNTNNTTKPTPTTSNSGSSTTKPTNTTSNNSSSTTKPTNTTSNNSSSTTKPTNTTSNNSSSTTKPTTTTSNNSANTTKPTDDSTTTREIITTTGNETTEQKNIGNYTIELLSGKTITIKNTTKRYIVSTRTDVEIIEENGYTYRVSKLIITYNTGFGQILETIKDRIK